MTASMLVTLCTSPPTEGEVAASGRTGGNS